MRRTFVVIGLALLIVSIALSAAAQLTTATIHGKVTNANGTAIPAAEIDAVNAASGFVKTAMTGPDGSYTMAGINPGQYNLVITAPGSQTRNETVQVLLGQNVEMNFVMSAEASMNQSITVVGNQLVETRTSEAATNVTPQQIENLPQGDRNFLNFAALAPGIRLSTDPLNKTIAGDAQPAEQTNVFIDGVSFKNDVLLGGLVGQDSSRGNPFPQNAVQEFRVITQNFSAQYDHASSAIITAVTKSGGNQFEGSAFDYYQPKAWVAPTTKGFQFSTLSTNSSYHRTQPGISFGGPIVKDRLNFFFSYEGVDEQATTLVNNINVPTDPQTGGAFPSPFKSNLAFGKMSWQPDRNQSIDVSGNYRREHETRDFGGTTSFQSGTDLKNWVYGMTARDQWNNANALNQATLSWQDYGWNPTPLNPNLVGMNFEGVGRVGGNSTTQEFDQRRIELRDDFNFAPMHWNGEHNFQIGGNFDKMHYNVNKSLFGNPEFDFRTDPANNLTFAQPYQAQFGFGNPILATNNNEYGIYGQDNWTINKNLSVTLGLRWDYESHMLDDNYVTPANIVAGLSGKIDPSYFSNGSQRKPSKDEFQPRLGFTYDVTGLNKTIVFGGFGKYYDRLFLNATLDERYRLQYPVYNIQFSPDGSPRNGAPTIKWNPAYLTPAGLNGLIASGVTQPEVYLLDNNTKVPYSNMFNLGVRQALGTWLGSLSYDGVRGYHGFTWLSAAPDGLCCAALVPGFGNIIKSDPEGKRYWYNAIEAKLDRPYTSQSRWGATVAWTHGRAEQTGNDLFSLDFPSAAAYGKHDVPGSERDRITATGIFGLPWDIKFSTIASFGSGQLTNVLDFTQGFSLANREATHPFSQSITPPKSGGFADRDVDFRVEKDFASIGRTSVGIIGGVYNAFNWTSYGCLNNFLGPGDTPASAGLGNPNCVIRLGRREEVGLKVNF
ncbi:MAG TPA: TonB-dependent receptor [Thermoanaerobaculia bacterium]|jgi:outer membrane receptor protein involved in Fe transport|nr:TonB-dependent receptor [Thermoanaerobaculia bacterium]